MKKLYHYILILAIVVIWGCSGSDSESIAQNNKEKKIEKSNKEVVWMKFDEGIAKGSKENKNIIVDFYTDWCHWCKVMDEKTFVSTSITSTPAGGGITIFSVTVCFCVPHDAMSRTIDNKIK